MMEFFKAFTAISLLISPSTAFTSRGVTSFASIHHRGVPPTVPINQSPSSSLTYSSLFSFLSSEQSNNNINDNDESITKRRAFLATLFASASILPASSFAKQPMNENSPLIYGDDSIMSPKQHGTTDGEVQDNLRYGVSRKLADKISSYNRVFAEMGGYFENTTFEDEVRRVVGETGGPVTFYDSVSGKPLFRAPINRSVDAFMTESAVHGWPSFRDDEVVWENVRVLKSSGETVSIGGTHLGHNLPDKSGNRYCINLVSIAGNP